MKIQTLHTYNLRGIFIQGITCDFALATPFLFITFRLSRPSSVGHLMLCYSWIVVVYDCNVACKQCLCKTVILLLFLLLILETFHVLFCATGLVLPLDHKRLPTILLYSLSSSSTAAASSKCHSILNISLYLSANCPLISFLECIYLLIIDLPIKAQQIDTEGR